MTLSRNNKILAAVAATAALLAAFWFVVLAPKRQEAATLTSQIEAKQREAAQATQQLASYEKARVAYKGEYAKLVRLGKAAPADDDVRSLMVQLDSVAGHRNVSFDKVDIGAGDTAGAAATPTDGTAATASTGDVLASAPGLTPLGTTGVSALPFSLSFSGSFQNLSGYFHQLQRFVSVRNERVRADGRLLRIESIDIVPGGTGWPHMIASVGAASYVVDPLPALGAQSAAPAAGTATPTTPPTGTTTAPATTTATVPGVAR